MAVRDINWDFYNFCLSLVFPAHAYLTLTGLTQSFDSGLGSGSGLWGFKVSFTF